jgi:hypothetical protein
MILLLLLCGSLAFADTLVMRDGSRHQGTLDSVSESFVTLDEGGGSLHRYRRSEVERIELTALPRSASMPPPATSPVPQNRNYSDQGANQQVDNQQVANQKVANQNDDRDRALEPGGDKFDGRESVTLPAGTDISVITTDPIDSKNASAGQTFAASIAQDVMDQDSGRVVIPKGTDAQLIIRDVNPGGSTGTSDVALDLQSISVAGHTYDVSTEDLAQQGNAGIGKNKRTGEYVGGGAVLGTLIGAIAGGGKGAAIGAIAGAGAGAGTQVLTRGKSVHVPSETTLNFRLDQPLHLRPE